MFERPRIYSVYNSHFGIPRYTKYTKNVLDKIDRVQGNFVVGNYYNIKCKFRGITPFNYSASEHEISLIVECLEFEIDLYQKPVIAFKVLFSSTEHCSSMLLKALKPGVEFIMQSNDFKSRHFCITNIDKSHE